MVGMAYRRNDANSHRPTVAKLPGLASWKDRSDRTRELKYIYGAIDDKAAKAALTTLESEFWPQIPSHCTDLAASLAASYPLLCLPKVRRMSAASSTKAIGFLAAK
jgi:transposase-like protein